MQDIPFAYHQVPFIIHEPDKNETKISKAYEVNSMKQCPAEEASGSSACPKKIQHFIESGSSLQCSQQAGTLPFR